LAVVDTNLFPAGFNNICEHGIEDAVVEIQRAVLKRVPEAKNILIIAEEHTRNTWYLENVRILQEIIARAGFHGKIATFLSVQPAFCENVRFVELETATGEKIDIYCLKKILNGLRTREGRFDMIIMNNDLTTGIPEILKDSTIPIYPSISAGWHSRLKASHFEHTEELMQEFARIINVDPWFFTCLYSVVEGVNINEEESRQRLAEEAEKLFARIDQKYQEYQIKEKPYLVLKSDSGTYGMGILAIESPDDILELNRKNKNKLYKGKSSKVIDRYLLQEGVPTIYNINNKIAETCFYQIDNNLIGGFYRSHTGKTSRQNLNSKGMDFQKMCPHSSKYGDCGVHLDINVFDIYRIIARIAGIAAAKEMQQLMTNDK